MSERRRDEVASWTTLVAVALSLLVTTWIGFRTVEAFLGTLASPLSRSTTADYTGLLASHLMVLQALALARLPWLERTWGRARLVRWHGRLAWTSWWLVVVHVLLFVAQRAARRPEALGDQMLDLFVREQHMLVASIGTAALLLVMLTSSTRVRGLLRYERWHLLHLWSYVGLGLALPHQLISADLATGWTLAYWWGLYVVAVAALVWFRLGLPILTDLRHRLRVAAVETDPSGATSVVVTGRRLARLGARSGQFLTWRWSGPGRTRGHPYSLSRAPDGQTLRITVAGSGDGARRVEQLTPGDRVRVEGPHGDLSPLRRRHPHLLMLTAGVGVTPFRALLEDTPLTPGEATLVVRASSAAHLVLDGELEALAAARGITLVRLVGPRRSPWSFLPVGVDGPAQEALLRLAPDLLTSDVYLSGPPAWSATVRRVARAAGCHRRDLHQEEFGW